MDRSLEEFWNDDAEDRAILRRGRHEADPSRWTGRLFRRSGAAWRQLMILVFPTECVFCGREDASLCAVCHRALRDATRTPFRAEAAASALVEVDGRVLLPTVAAGIYRGELARSVLAYKNHGRTDLRPALAPALAGALNAAAGATARRRGVLLIPVPTSGRSFRRRGFDPVGSLLSYLDSHGGLPTGARLESALRLRPRTPFLRKTQKGLGSAGRRANVRGSMFVPRYRRPRFAGALCLLVDDVVTTGATLGEAARALRCAGAVVIGAVTLAAARPPGGAHDVGVAGQTAGGLPEKINDEKVNNRVR